jgi:transposase
VFADNCSVHHSKLVKKFAEEQDIVVIFNIPYSPQYNPIEVVWSLVKQKYKKAKLESLMTHSKINHQQVVKRCLESVEAETISTICSKSLKRHFHLDDDIS